MPNAPKRPCRGCGRATDGRYCSACLARGAGKDTRPTSNQRGYTYRWQKVSQAFRAKNPLCADPYGLHADAGRIVLGELTDHIKPHRGDPTLMYDESNFQNLCRACHGMKTAKEDGGFGNRIRHS